MIRSEGYIEIGHDELEFVVSMANRAGFMERAGRIYVESDAKLRDACLDALNIYDGMICVAREQNLEFPDFGTLAEDMLYAWFAPTHEE